ncbi:MAG: FtsQ-type POTRA domain-containing protein [Ruminococcus sp.]|nr:FtsQ-type POTRA domain-containing protein [Ruminococcus sp.]
MSKKQRSRDYRDGYDSFDRPDVMDRIGDSFTSAFSRRSRENEKADDALYEFSKKGRDDFFVDESARRKTTKKPTKKPVKKSAKPPVKQALTKKKKSKKTKIKKPVTPLMRKIRNIIACCVIVAIVLIVCVVLSLTVLFKTQNYTVTGNTKYDQNEIITTCGITKNENIFLANKRSAEKKLMKAYPYIEAVDVSFAIPDTITIDVIEAVPAYIVKVTDSQFLIVSSQGRILEQVGATKGYDIPLFLGPDVSNAVVGEYVEFEGKKTLEIINEIVSVFVDNGYTGITELDATDPGNISFTYDGRIKVKLGLPEDISYKVRTAMTIILEKLDLNGTTTTEGELDVSSCNTTKKSYFKEQSLIEAETQPTEVDGDNENGQTVENEYIDEDYDGYDDITGEIIPIEEEEEETQAPISQDDWYL